jgi:TfoX/Sxy family transcriptional regulator of competence genes
MGYRRYAAPMAFDEGLAERVRALVADDADAQERKMFGGLCFLCDGNMACGIVGDELMVRVGPDAWSDALREPFAREMDFTGRSMKGMVYVGVAGVAEDVDLATWVERGTAYARSLPPK